MTTPPPAVSAASTALARRLFALAAGHASEASDDAARLAASERMWTAVADRLSRWFGPYGSLALITRALHSAQPHHRSLSCVSVSTSPLTRNPSLTGLADSALRYGAVAASEGSIAAAATLTELIGRLIGDDLATTMLEQSITHSSPADENGVPPASGAVPPTVNEP